MAGSSRIIGSLIASLLCAAPLAAFDNNPWMGDLGQLEADFWGQALVAERLYVEDHSHRRHLQDYAWGVDGQVRFKALWDARIGLSFARPNVHSTGYQASYLQTRYCVLDDIVGDPISMLVGFRLTVPGAWTREILTELYHAPVEGLLLVEVGKEFSRGPFWVSRIWGQLNLGQGTQGFPWIDSNLWLEGQWTGCSGPFANSAQFGLVLDYLAGTGHYNLNPHDFHHGYSAIRYRAADSGARFCYNFDLTHESLQLTYRYRWYAHNFPGHAHIGNLTWVYRF
jgi:hypothetical protein